MNTDNVKTLDRLDSSLLSLLRYCKENDWAGYDPYDALNSRLFAATPFVKSRICRIGFTQVLKRLPFNIRPFLLISKAENPKSAALFLKASLKLARLKLDKGDDLIGTLSGRLAMLRSPDTEYWCWGYSFPWQTRTIQVPRWTPNLVSTFFSADALLDTYDEKGNEEHLKMGLSAAEYFKNELYWSDSKVAGFCYPLPTYRSRVHNSNFLGASLLCRAYAITGEKGFLAPALKVARYSASMMHEDGSWFYGEKATQNWIDNFHTGYNLDALRDIARYLQTDEFDTNIEKGYRFYKEHFFTDDGAPRYFHNSTYPIDIHSVAQSIITLVKFSDYDDANTELAQKVLSWAIEKMWDERGYFYSQVKPYYKIKIPYMRWGLAWMLLALATLKEHTSGIASVNRKAPLGRVKTV